MKKLNALLNYVYTMNDGIYTLLALCTLLPLSALISYYTLANLSEDVATLTALILGAAMVIIIVFAILLYRFANVFINLKLLVAIFCIIFGMLLILQIVATGGHTIYDGVPY